jgi:hypothetical protein
VPPASALCLAPALAPLSRHPHPSDTTQSARPTRQKQASLNQPTQTSIARNPGEQQETISGRNSRFQRDYRIHQQEKQPISTSRSRRNSQVQPTAISAKCT